MCLKMKKVYRSDPAPIQYQVHLITFKGNVPQLVVIY